MKIKIAVIPTQLLGDGLALTYLSDLLARNDFEVTLFNNSLAQLSHWAPQVRFEKMPDYDHQLQVLSQYDLLYLSYWASKHLNPDVISQRRDKIVFYGDSLNRKKHKIYRKNLEKIVLRHHSNPMLKLFYDAEGLSPTHHDLSKNVVENIYDFCKNTLNLKDVSKQVNLFYPTELRKKTNQIIMHPDSSNYKKNWAPNKYLKLAEMLKEKGYHVIFSVSPKEYKKWDAIIQQNFTLTRWDLKTLAEELYQSRLFVGSDSGPGHLASMLGTTTVTIFIRKRTYYTWRPGWSDGYIAAPSVPFSFIKARTHLRSPLTVKQVFRVAMTALGAGGSTS